MRNALASNTRTVFPWTKIYQRWKNSVVDALSPIEISDNKVILDIHEMYGYNDADLTDIAYPNHYHDIVKAQKTDSKLNQKIVTRKEYILDTFLGGNQNHRLIWRNIKICLPVALQKKTVDWYHQMICHTGETRTKHTLCQYFKKQSSMMPQIFA